MTWQKTTMIYHHHHYCTRRIDSWPIASNEVRCCDSYCREQYALVVVVDCFGGSVVGYQRYFYYYCSLDLDVPTTSWVFRQVGFFDYHHLLLLLLFVVVVPEGSRRPRLALQYHPNELAARPSPCSTQSSLDRRRHCYRRHRPIVA